MERLAFLRHHNFPLLRRGYDGAEVCDLAGLFILNSLQTLFGKDVLYRDDGLTVLNTKSGRLSENERCIAEKMPANSAK